MKKLKFLSLSLVLMLGATVFMGSGCSSNQEQTQEQNQEQNQEIASEQTAQTVTVAINYGDEEKNYEVDFGEGMTAYDALKAAAEKDALEIKTTDYDFGMSVDAIGDKEGGVDGKYWMYYIDGTTSPVAADKQILTEGMKVEFKYEASTM